MCCIENLHGSVARIGMAQIIRYLRKQGVPKGNELTIYSSIIDLDVGYRLAGSLFLPNNYCDAMPAFPIFLEYWPCVWGTDEDFKRKTFVFNPDFLDCLVHLKDERFERMMNDILKYVDTSKHDPEVALFKVV